MGLVVQSTGLIHATAPTSPVSETTVVITRVDPASTLKPFPFDVGPSHCMRHSPRTRFLIARSRCSMLCVVRVIGPSVRRKANALPLDVSNQCEVDEVRVALVLSFAAVALREPDATVNDTVDGTAGTPSAPITSIF